MKSNTFQVKHSIPGRVRVRISRLRQDEEMAGKVVSWLMNSGFAVQVEARPVTGSLIVFYDPEKAEERELLSFLRGWKTGIHLQTAGPVRQSGEIVRDTGCSLECRQCRTDSKPSFFKQIAGLVFLTGYVVFVFIKKTIFRQPVSESPLSLTSMVAAVGAWPLLKHAWGDLREGRYRSLFPFLAGTFFLAIIMGEALTALEVIWILRVGTLLEDYVAERSRKAIRNILRLAERETYVLVDGVEVEIKPDRLRRGDVVVCHTGEKIPVDGTIVRGEALVDESPITGRAEPEERRAGDRVFAGVIVTQGVICISAEKVGDSTYLARILRMVEESLETRAPSEKKADALADRLMRIGFLTVAGTFLITFDPMRAFTVLLVLACPCATVLAASTAVSAALANAAKNHVLIKGGLYLEEIGRADTFCFDKTGTITSEVPRLVEIIPRTHTQKKDTILALAAAAEMHNRHPVAMAIVKDAEARGLDIVSHAVCEFVVGRGVRAKVEGCEILVGNGTLMEESGVDCRYFMKRAQKEIEQGNMVVFIAREKKVQGMLIVANTMRPDVRNVIQWLRRDGVSEFHLISGDAAPVVQNMAADLGIEKAMGDLLPEDKAQYIDSLEEMRRRTVMVGDGVNDAIALARSSIGVAMGAGGAEVAIEAADITLVSGELERLVMLRQLSRKTTNVIEQNYMIAMGTNLGGVMLGAAGFLSPVMAGALHTVHTLGILLNSGRLLGWKPTKPEAPQTKRRMLTDREEGAS